MAPRTASRTRSSSAAAASESASTASVIGSQAAVAQLAEPLELEGAQRRQLRCRQHAAMVVEHEARQDRAVVHQPAAGAEHVVAGADQPVGLDHHAADRHLVDHLGRIRRQPQHVAILDQQRVRHAHLLRQALVRVQVARLAVHRHRDLAA